MDDETHTPPRQPTSKSRPGLGGGIYHAGTINTSSGDMAMIGCTTTSNFTFTSTPAVPSDFRMIPLGDIDLQHEIHVDYATGAVHRENERRACARRVYSARVEGRSLTVAMYQGHSAQEEWKQDIAKYISLRHPHFIQLCGAANSGSIHATIFHGDLIPLRQFLDLHRNSPLVTVYIYAISQADFEAAHNYFDATFHRPLSNLDCTLWIRGSSGRVCAELIKPTQLLDMFFWIKIPAMEIASWGAPNMIHGMQGIYSLGAPDTEAMVIDSLTLEAYHSICSWNLGRYESIPMSTSTAVNLGAVIDYGSSIEIEDFVEIVSSPNMGTDHDHWTASGVVGEVMEDGWIRLNSNNVLNGAIIVCTRTRDRQNKMNWLSQANHIFSRLQITSNFEDYVFVGDVRFLWKISWTRYSPTGFLFLCPNKDFQTGPSSFRWPDCPAYWSLDPFGAEGLSMEEAAWRGFPSIELETEIIGRSWDASVYAGLRQFHQAKGFDPDSQDVARHLAVPFYQLSQDVFARVNEVDCDEEKEDSDTEDSEDAQSSIDDHPNNERHHISLNTDEESGGDTLVPATVDLPQDAKQIPAKRSFEDTLTSEHESTAEQGAQDDLALRRLILDKKAQLIEMFRLGIFTKDEIKAQIAQIDARYEIATRPSPAKRARFTNSDDVGFSRDVGNM